jgi:hypothetical protein
MSLNFPSAPTANETYTLDGRTWLWDGNAWTLTFGPLSSLSSISVSDIGGDGSLSYDSQTGVITYQGPTASEVRSHFSSGTGISIAGGVISVSGNVVTTDAIQTLTNKNINGGYYTGQIKHQTYTLTGTTLDPTKVMIQSKQLSVSTTFTETLTDGTSIVLLLTFGSSYPVTWPVSAVWVTSVGNNAPTLTASDVLVLWKVSGALYGAYVGSAA